MFTRFRLLTLCSKNMWLLPIRTLYFPNKVVLHHKRRSLTSSLDFSFFKSQARFNPCVGNWNNPIYIATAGFIYFLLLFQLYVYQVMTKPSLWQMSNIIRWGKTGPPQVFVGTKGGLSMVLTWRWDNFQFSSFYLYSYNSQQKIKILQQYRVNPNNQMPPVSKKNSLFLWMGIHLLQLVWGAIKLL